MTKTNKTYKSIFQAVFLLVISPALPAQADTPDAGLLLQQLIKQPDLNPSAPVELLRAPAVGEAKVGAPGDIRIMVNKVKVTGSVATSAEFLEAMVADLIGAEHNFAEISAGVNRITNWYRLNGYLVARAYLPEQDLKEGLVVIDVMEGLLGAQQINNRSRLADAKVKQHMASIDVGVPLKSQAVDRAVLLLSDTPGVGGARAALRPGASVGTSDLVFELPVYSQPNGECLWRPDAGAKRHARRAGGCR